MQDQVMDLQEVQLYKEVQRKEDLLVKQRSVVQEIVQQLKEVHLRLEEKLHNEVQEVV